MSSSVSVSVIIPSRNRPTLLRKAIQSVLEQSHRETEILVVNDGSDGPNLAAYQSLAAELKSRVLMLDLEATERGHGQSYAINRGVERAQGEFVTFLDDDDFWTDPEHLARASRALCAADSSIDLYYTNQAAYLGDEQVKGPLWLEELEHIVKTTHRPDGEGVYDVSVEDLMRCNGFQHLNTSVVRRTLYLDIGGMDENIRYECDWDFYLRCIDVARGIRYFPGMTSHHNAPDPSKTLNMSTVVTVLQKLLFRSYVMDKAVLFSKSPAIRKAATRNKGYTLKRITEKLVSDGNYELAAVYARESLSTGLSPKWLLYCGYLGLRALAQPRA
ncbi:glycosyltransferase [Azoarcus sp. L1K30]|uniref:glycosyltransferase family 2 protein n=1 Tax=Azoarcus sp. L1K30 TaxID=2820277 RepID=UPI001B816D70|nr:glycosyltransferase [Azoarcus sp. L1K30]MBR0568581.1 glycosyltransferase [Azoarcus sp. L1K30]